MFTRNGPNPKSVEWTEVTDRPFRPGIVNQGITLFSNGCKAHETLREHRAPVIVGNSPGISAAMNLARKTATARSTILLLGETGTGKENFAKAIHAWSDRARKSFVAINCVGLSKDLLESELFGHERGAFTGAHQVKQGKIELAHGGTVFLDEVGDISPEIQTKLLRFLQERCFERVGGTNTINVDVRIIAATNRNLEQAVREGGFRLDLYFRLNVIPIELPPLRHRKSDIPALAEYFLERYAAESGKESLSMSEAALEKLKGHNWPGNVRELANVVERAIVLTEGAVITADEIKLSTTTVEHTHEHLESLPYHEAVHAFRRKIISRALEQEGSQVAAARALRLQKTYLCRLIRDLQIK